MKNITNTTPLTRLFEIGEIIFLEEDSAFAFEVVSSKMVRPLFGEGTKSMSFANGVRLSLEIITGEHVNDFSPNNLVVNKDGLTVSQVGEINNIGLPTKINKGKGGVGPVSLNHQTVYSNLLTASDVVRSDIPEAIGYDPNASALWNSYLDGGDGALASKALSSELMDKGWSTDCCGSYTRAVAGFTLCAKCGGEATFNLINSEGS